MLGTLSLSLKTRRGTRMESCWFPSTKPSTKWAMLCTTTTSCSKNFHIPKPCTKFAIRYSNTTSLLLPSLCTFSRTRGSVAKSRLTKIAPFKFRPHHQSMEFGWAWTKPAKRMVACGESQAATLMESKSTCAIGLTRRLAWLRHTLTQSKKR